MKKHFNKKPKQSAHVQSKPKPKVVQELAKQFEADLNRSLPISIQPNGSIVYKQYFIKQIANGNWGLFSLASKDLIEEFYLNKMGSSSKNLIELFFSKKYTLFRIKTSYPCDHIAVPNEKKKYVKTILDKYFKYQLDELCGKKIELEFGKNLYTYTKFYLEK